MCVHEFFEVGAGVDELADAADDAAFEFGGGGKGDFPGRFGFGEFGGRYCGLGGLDFRGKGGSWQGSAGMDRWEVTGRDFGSGGNGGGGEVGRSGDRVGG